MGSSSTAAKLTMDLSRCREEQERCKEELKRPGLSTAEKWCIELGLNDWMTEEILIIYDYTSH